MISMLLITHIIIALSGLAASTYALFDPSRSKLRVSYGLVIATILTGTYLVVSTHARILSSCITGLAYIGVSLSLILSAQHRLSAERSNRRD
jgi:hypothetical protein